MDTIDNYLNAVFSPYPPTPRTAEAKAELRAMMEDAYHGALAAGRSQNEAIGLAISEFGNLDEVAPLLDNPSADALPNHSQMEATPRDFDFLQSSPQTPRRPGPTITLAQAVNFAEVMRRTRWLLAGGIAIIIIGVAPLLGLVLGSSSPDFPMSEGVAVAIGLSFLLLFTAIGAGMLVWRAQLLSPFSRITTHVGIANPEAVAWAESLRSEHSASRTKALIVAIALWIASALPTVVTALLVETRPQEQQDPWLGLGLVGTMLLVAAGLLVFLPATWAHMATTPILAPYGMATPPADAADARYPVWARAFFAGYWPLVTTIYLAWSFLADAWDTSWILWPIAAVFFAAVAATLSAVYSRPQVN